MSKSISQIIKSTGNQLERQAANQFGGAVEDFTRGKLGLSKPGVGTQLPGELKPQSRSWDATSYAAVLAGATEFRPKLKFLFKVQFFFDPAVVAEFPELARNEFTFMIKSVDRPKVDFEYEDDVNQYNFRTKVLKKIKHRELTITFMDDVGNNVFDFFRSLLMIHSPITRGSVLRDNDYNAVPNARRYEQGSGMSFSGLEAAAAGGKTVDTAHRGSVNSHAGNAISLIRVKQIFIDPTITNQADKGKAIKSNYYDFINPRLVSFDLDDLNHESSDPNLLTMQFDYDWLEMTKNAGISSLSDGLNPVMATVVPSKTASDVSGIPSDMLLGRNTGIKGSPTVERGKSNPFAGILSAAAGNATQAITKDLADRVVKGVVGDSGFGRSKIGKAITGGVSDALGGIAGSVSQQVSGAVGSVVGGVTDAANGAIGSLGGLISTGIRDAGNGLVSTLSSATSRLGASNFARSGGAAVSSSAVFADRATAGPDRPLARVQSQPAITPDSGTT